MIMCNQVQDSFIKIELKCQLFQKAQNENSASPRFYLSVYNNNYIIDSMISTKPKTKRIGKHHFRLIGQSHLYFKGQHIVSFAPLPKNKQKTNTKILPTFNNDRKYYTYAFQLPSATSENDEQMRQEHEKRALQSMIQLSQMLVPKPRSRHKYCGVCRNHYEDYKDHIQSEIHLTNLKKSQYQALINQMCQDYQIRNVKKQSQEVKAQQLTAQEVQFKANAELCVLTGKGNPQLV